MNHKEDVRVSDRTRMTLKSIEGAPVKAVGKQSGGAPPIKVVSNVRLQLKDPGSGKVKEERKGHNIFLNYGREWLAELIGLDTGPTPFRNDRIKYVAFGIGGTSQQIASATIRGTWAGFPDDWTNPGGTGGSGTGDPAQTDVDPTVTGLEYPVLIDDPNYPTVDNNEVYYDAVSVPTTYPDVGIARFTAVLGPSDISFGSFTSVPISEIGLFTESVPNLYTAPLAAPPVRYMVAYNTFDTLSKTSAFVLQVDWEIRFS